MSYQAQLSCPKCGSPVSSETLICSDCKIEIQPLKIFDSAIVDGSTDSITLDFGAHPRDKVTDYLFRIGEIELVEKIAGSSLYPLHDILTRLDLDINNCWIATNIKTDKLIENSLADKLQAKSGGVAGDIDLIIGDIVNKDLSFSRLIAFQAKRRKLTLNGKSYLPSGTGTGQSSFTALMGFDKTILLHILVREPKQVSSPFAASWNPIINSDFPNMVRASYGIIKERLKREWYGYAWLGWGQAYGREPEETGGIPSDVVVVPPQRPMNHDADVCAAREMMTRSLINLLSIEKKKQGGIKKSPFILKGPIRA